MLRKAVHKFIDKYFQASKTSNVLLNLNVSHVQAKKVGAIADFCKIEAIRTVYRAAYADSLDSFMPGEAKL